MITLLTDILEKNAQEYPERSALSMKLGYRTKSFTYQQVYDMARCVAQWLDHEGIGKGDSVLILAPNSPYWGIVLWGCILRGVVIVPLNVQSTAEMLDRAAQQTGAKILFKHLYFKQDIPSSVKAFDIELLEELLVDIDPQAYTPTELQPDDLIEILYTSGTTGDPKGVMLTHKNICSNINSMHEIIPLGQRKQERLLSILPLSHIFEQTIGFFLAQQFAAHIVYAHTVAAIRQLMVQYHITIMLAVPEFLSVMLSRIRSTADEKGKTALLERMMKLSRRIGSRSFARRMLFRKLNKQFGGHWNMVASGGAPLDPELEHAWNDLGIFVIQGYGLTETSPSLTSNSPKFHKYGSVGKAIPDVSVRLGEGNEVQAQGDNVFQGYYKNPEKTKEAFTEDGWFRTGDIGEFDDDGFLFLKGREKYMILGPGGQNVFPEDVEEELRKIKGVKDCTVIGMEKPHGVEVHAVLLMDPDVAGVEPAKVVDEANSHLASYQHIGGYSVWPDDDFPRSATRKVQKGKVSDYLASHADEKGGSSPAVQKTKLERVLASVTGADFDSIHSATRIVPELGLDSLMRVELVARIEQDFGVVVDEGSITSSTTVEELDAVVAEAKPASELPQLPTWPRNTLVRGLRRVLQAIIMPLVKTQFKVKVEGYDNIKDLEGPVIYMPNHVSFIDGGVVAQAFKPGKRAQLTFAAAEDVLYEEFGKLAWVADLVLNSFPLPRAGGNINYGLNNIGQMLDLGYSVILFPEGAVSTDGKFQELKKGTGLIATQMEVPIVPIKITGAREIVEYGKLIPHTKGTVNLKFGKPLYFKRSDSFDDARKKIAEAIQAL